MRRSRRWGRVGVRAGYATRERQVAGYTTAPSDGVPPKFPISAAEMFQALGFGSADIWKHLYDLDAAALPCNDRIGTAHLNAAFTVVNYTLGVATGLPPANDKGIQTIDGGGGIQHNVATFPDITTVPFALLLEARFTALPSATRIAFGHDGAKDWLVRITTSGDIQLITFDGTTSRTSSVVGDHTSATVYRTILAVCIPGSNQRMASDLGLSTATSTVGMVTLTDATGVLAVGRSASSPPMIATVAAIAISDGSGPQNAAIQALYDNLPAAVANFRAFSGR